MPGSDPGGARARTVRTEGINERLHELKASRSSLIGSITKNINRISVLFATKGHQLEVEQLMSKLLRTLEKLAQTTRKFVDFVDKHEGERALSLLAEQELKVSQISELCENYVLTNFENPPEISIKKPEVSSPGPRGSSHRSVKSRSNSHHSSKSAGSSVSSSSSVSKGETSSSLKSLLRKRADLETADLRAKQAEAKYERELRRLEKEKQLQSDKLMEEVQDARDSAELAKLEVTLEAENFNQTINENRLGSMYSVPTVSKMINFDEEQECSNRNNYKSELISKTLDFNIDSLPSIPAHNLAIPQRSFVPETRLQRTFVPEAKERVEGFKTPPRQDLTPQKTFNEPIDKFIDDLIEGRETVLKQKDGISTSKILQWEFESRNLPAIALTRFDGSPKVWPEFIENFKTRVHLKNTFDDNTRMERLLSVLDGEAKRAVESIGSSGIFYATALKALKRDFGNAVVVSQLKLNAVLNLPQLQANDRIGLRRFHQQLSATNIWLTSMGYNSALKSTEHLAKAVARLPNFLRTQFYKSSADKVFIEGGINLIDFEHWLDHKLKEHFNPISSLISDFEKGKNDLKCSSKDKTPKESVKVRTFHSNRSVLKCWVCGKDHKVSACIEFTSLSIEARRKSALEKGLCFNCLSSNHKIKDCTSRKRCQQDKCGRKHHTLLHELKLPKDEEIKPLDDNDQTCNAVRNSDVIYLQIIPVILYHNSKSILTNAILDSGSDSTLIRHDIAEKLGLDGEKKSMKLTNVLTNSVKITSKIVNFQISSTTAQNKSDIKNAWVVHDLNIPLKQRNIKDLKSKYPHLQNVDLPTLNKGDVTVLIGVDFPMLHIQNQIKSGQSNEPIAIETPLGWVLFGGNDSKKSHDVNSNFVHVESQEMQLENILERFWEIDSYPTLNKLDPKMLNPQENRAMNILNKNTTKVNGHFEIGLLWKTDNPELPNNRQLAVNRLLSIEKKFKKNPAFAETYKEQVLEYINLGFASKLNDTELNTNSNIVNYMPHHGVTYPNKPGKIRVVFDAAARFKGTSLNDLLLPGPDLLNNLVTILSRFRLGKYAIMSDIEKMFHQVYVPVEERSALRFVFRVNPCDEIIDYKMNVHLFGKRDSPCIANWALRKSAEDFDEVVRKAIEEKFYMDDYLDSGDDEAEIVEVSKRLAEALDGGGFHLTKWLSNSSAILAAMPKSELKKLDLDLDKLPIDRALGMLWDPNNDVFSFKSLLREFPDTKRGVLSLISTIFDPLGILTPFILEGKLIVQSLWERKIDWDEPLPADLQHRWDSWKKQLSHISSIIVPRWTGLQNAFSEIHVFSDASTAAYGAVAYLRTQYSLSTQTSFILGKSRIAPIGKKTRTVPRLELKAAVLAVRMRNYLCEEIFPHISRVKMWTDSEIVLKSLANEERKFDVFFTNRLNEIRSSTDVSDWNFVPGDLNPGDDATRYLPLVNLPDSRWLSGPLFLTQTEEHWPEQPTLAQSTQDAPRDVQQVTVNASTTNDDSEFQAVKWEHYSSWTKLVRHVTWILKLKTRWLDWKRNRKSSQSFDHLTVKEMSATKIELLKIAQQESFPDELRSFRNSTSLPRRSKLIPLRPIFQDGLLRVGGRVGLAHIPYDAKHQILLSPKHHLSTLIAMEMHENNFHVGRNSTLALIRERFWIITGKSFVRSLIYRCSLCKRRRIQPTQPLMGNLPEDRISLAEPAFNRTGVDYFGPLYVKRGRRTRSQKGTEKRYGALFTCMTTRAVHLELAGDLSTDSFILALRRFTARRGHPKTITSDNGSNFVGAERELGEALQALDQDRISRELSEKEIEWKFNSPLAPWMGGAMESLVKSTKRALKTVVRDRLFTEEALTTLLTEVESTLNSRPLTPITDDLDDFQALTPNHFLLGRSSPNSPLGDFSKDIDSRRKWRSVQAATSMFWKRWLKEYLPSLTIRRKWTDQTTNLKPGDLVIITDNNVIRSHWPLGRILKVYPGADGIVRKADVKTANGCYTRPAASLSLLEG